MALSFLCGLPGVGDGLRAATTTPAHHCACPVGLEGCSCAAGQTASCHGATKAVVEKGQPAISHRCLEQETPVLALSQLPPPPGHVVVLALPSASTSSCVPDPLPLAGRLRDSPTPPPLVS